MNGEIGLILLQDGMANGAIYALLAIAIVLVFAVTRILFIPQGEFVVFGALTMVAVQAGHFPRLVWLAVALGLLEAAADAWAFARGKRRGSKAVVTLKAALPLAVAALLWGLPLGLLPMALQALLVVAVIVPMGPQLYRLFYQPIATASPLVLLIVSIAVHVGLVGISLWIFGPQGAQTRPFVEANLEWAGHTVSSQIVWVVLVSAVLVVAMVLFFERSLFGKALRATAFNRTGARLVGISPVFAGKLAFTLAALIGAVSGILIAPVTALYYDSGLLIALKGFVGAVIGALVGYPLAAAGAILVGLLEAFAAFWASTYKEVIVFALLIPVLVWRSLASPGGEEEAE